MRDCGHYCCLCNATKHTSFSIRSLVCVCVNLTLFYRLHATNLYPRSIQTCLYILQQHLIRELLASNFHKIDARTYYTPFDTHILESIYQLAHGLFVRVSKGFTIKCNRNNIILNNIFHWNKKRFHALKKKKQQHTALVLIYPTQINTTFNCKKTGIFR